MQKYFKLSAEKMRAICGIAESRIFPVVAIENNTVGGKGFDAFVSLDSGDGWFKGAYVGKLEMFAARGEFVTEAEYLAQDAAVVEEVETITAQPVAATWEKSRDELGYVHTLQTGHDGYFVKVQKSHAGDYFVTAQHVHDIAGGDVEYKKDLRAAKRFAETLVETSQWMDYTFDPVVTRASLAQPVADEWTPEEDADAWKARDAALIAAAKDRGAALSLVERIAPQHARSMFKFTVLAIKDASKGYHDFRKTVNAMTNADAVAIVKAEFPGLRAVEAVYRGVSLDKPDAPECVCILADVTQESNADVMARAVTVVRDRRLTAEYVAGKDGDGIDHDDDEDDADPMGGTTCDSCGCALESGQVGDCEDCADDNGEPSNDERADWAQAAMNEFARVTRMDTAGEDDETIMGDLLCNLMHAAKRSGIDWVTVMARASWNFDFECREEDA